ncbi:hypothetical protein M153_6900017823 [Pseudoloma neurophilia]|uniref:Uncharacterized protein n=1 Tax=Pseudoloma neurophilia TaxID=146866 RepID=A0A0R0M0C7_9MICR|nr:hypothetical protein M153_6900017823 [Pseudoloma neurophilia]
MLFLSYLIIFILNVFSTSYNPYYSNDLNEINQMLTHENSKAKTQSEELFDLRILIYYGIDTSKECFDNLRQAINKFDATRAKIMKLENDKKMILLHR